MKITQCDQCGKQAPAELSYGNPPKDWWFLRRPDYVKPEEHLCSLECVIARAQTLQTEKELV